MKFKVGDTVLAGKYGGKAEVVEVGDNFVRVKYLTGSGNSTYIYSTKRGGKPLINLIQRKNQ